MNIKLQILADIHANHARKSETTGKMIESVLLKMPIIQGKSEVHVPF